MATMKVSVFVTQALAHSGLALADTALAFKLRPDLWASGQDCAMDFGTAYQKGDLANIATATGAHRLAVRLTGAARPVQVLARSMDNIEKRIEWLAGIKVASVETWKDAPRPDQTPLAVLDARSIEDDRLRRLRLRAAEDPPSHDCHRRREILKARAELAQTGAHGPCRS